ncbi:MAG: DUF4390 domain-containing protein [Deltaproteobacteria bacterium]|nr:DUF4390 domain-containing protein [Deltaproteobacteria bacterium]
MAKAFWIGILIILFASASPLSLAKGEEAFIEGLRMEREKGALSISFSVKNCFNNKMEEAIKAGVPTTFNFFVRLHKKRPIIWDKKIANHQFQHDIVYDNLKKDFRIWLEEKGKEIRVKDLEEAKVYMARVEGFTVAVQKELKGGRYELAIKAELDPVKLPLRLECILFFVSLWDFETDWYHHTFKVEQ